LGGVLVVKDVLDTLDVLFEGLKKKVYSLSILTWRISWLTATSIGDLPSEFLANKVGCLVRRNLRQS